MGRNRKEKGLKKEQGIIGTTRQGKMVKTRNGKGRGGDENSGKVRQLCRALPYLVLHCLALHCLALPCLNAATVERQGKEKEGRKAEGECKEEQDKKGKGRSRNKKEKETNKQHGIMKKNRG